MIPITIIYHNMFVLDLVVTTINLRIQFRFKILEKSVVVVTKLMVRTLCFLVFPKKNLIQNKYKRNCYDETKTRELFIKKK